MSKSKTPRIELTFGVNDEDVLAWIDSKGVSKATFVKRLLREKMNEEMGGVVAPASVIPQRVTHIEPEFEPEPENTGVKKFGFADKMNAGGGVEF